MEDTAVLQNELPAAASDLSIWNLFLEADWVVKLVILGLLFASIWCWAIIIEKFLLVRRLRARTDAFEETFWSGLSLDDLYERVQGRADNPMVLMFTAAMREWRRAGEQDIFGRSIDSGLRERVEKIMTVTLGREMESLERHLGFLATVGSTAPFIGLFGTVWGIMNSFQAIALSHNTSLAVVAPGIAEALFATALGLLAAIPAVIFYNKFANDLARYAARLESFAEEFSTILSRQLDERAA